MAASLLPAFTFHTRQAVLPGLVTVGKYDDEHPALTCGTTAGMVFMHAPQERGSDGNAAIRFLNINRKITALCAGRLHANHTRDVLVVGTQTNLMAYDVDTNTDVFYKVRGCTSARWVCGGGGGGGCGTHQNPK